MQFYFIKILEGIFQSHRPPPHPCFIVDTFLLDKYNLLIHLLYGKHHLNQLELCQTIALCTGSSLPSIIVNIIKNIGQTPGVQFLFIFCFLAPTGAQ